MAEQFTADELAHFREAFNVFDSNGNGQITKEDLGRVMRSLGQKPSDAELQDMLNEVDLDQSGAVDFQEFLQMMSKKGSKTSMEQELQEAFKVFDADGTGTISREELKHVMKSIGEQLSEEEIDEMLRIADKDGDGHIDYNEFVAIMVGESDEPSKSK
ncbi:hypothetical protein N3K66_005117 [Trichothecium roseum]|uniref:Uncharacterized protein n=1 Tax=Trichothecium roseum TaxID=47278 RepID=A0ACC0V382_9HYPO|nr:hypothetical protein N3K66_005117 [Trichothecium roseum]